MKLYNILEEIIFESSGILSEGITKSDAQSAIDSHRRIKIYYQGDKENQPGIRYIDVYAFGVSKAGNDVIRVYQAFGVTTTEIGWKLLRLDRISRWEPTGQYISPGALDKDPRIPKRNVSGDKSMTTIYSIYKAKVKQTGKTNVKPEINKTEEPVTTTEI